MSIPFLSKPKPKTRFVAGEHGSEYMKAYCDGVALELCEECDTAAGWAICFEVSNKPGPSPQLDPVTGALKHVFFTGKIEVIDTRTDKPWGGESEHPI